MRKEGVWLPDVPEHITSQFLILNCIEQTTPLGLNKHLPLENIIFPPSYKQPLIAR